MSEFQTFYNPPHLGQHSWEWEWELGINRSWCLYESDLSMEMMFVTNITVNTYHTWQSYICLSGHCCLYNTMEIHHLSPHMLPQSMDFCIYYWLDLWTNLESTVFCWHWRFPNPHMTYCPVSLQSRPYNVDHVFFFYSSSLTNTKYKYK